MLLNERTLTKGYVHLKFATCKREHNIPTAKLLMRLFHFYRDVISIDDYTLCFDNIDPLAPQKKWTVNGSSEPSPELKKYVRSQKVQAVFVVSDSVDWSRDIQVILLYN